MYTKCLDNLPFTVQFLSTDHISINWLSVCVTTGIDKQLEEVHMVSWQNKTSREAAKASIVEDGCWKFDWFWDYMIFIHISYIVNTYCTLTYNHHCFIDISIQYSLYYLNSLVSKNKREYTVSGISNFYHNIDNHPKVSLSRYQDFKFIPSILDNNHLCQPYSTIMNGEQ